MSDISAPSDRDPTTDDEEECVLCGASGEDVTLHRHHRTPKSEGGSDRPENIVKLCGPCHIHHHSRSDIDDVQVDLASAAEGSDIDPTPADFALIEAIKAIGPASRSDISDRSGVSYEHTRRRLWMLASLDIVAQSSDGQWGLTDEIENPAEQKLPDSSEDAARLARDDVIRRMYDHGISTSEISDIVGFDAHTTVAVSICRARSLDPPVPATDESEPDLEEIERRLIALERQMTDHGS